MRDKPKGSGIFIWKGKQGKLLGGIENTKDGYIVFRIGISQKTKLHTQRMSALFKEMAQEIKKFGQKNNLKTGFYETKKRKMIYQVIWLELEDLEKNYLKLRAALSNQLGILSSLNLL
jgi:hypothetical protein